MEKGYYLACHVMHDLIITYATDFYFLEPVAIVQP
jgi:hypothetical protein